LQEFQDTLAGTINWARYAQNILSPEVMLEKFINGVAAAEARISEVQLIKAYLDFHFK
jgi:L-ribulose-5-phosphate 3-epimerase UlaE